MTERMTEAELDELERLIGCISLPLEVRDTADYAEVYEASATEASAMALTMQPAWPTVVNVVPRLLAMARSLTAPPKGGRASLVEPVGNIGRNITITPNTEWGNAVISPDMPDGPYWTLIAQGGDDEQDAIGAEIVRRLNAATALSTEPTPDAGRDLLEALDWFGQNTGLELSCGTDDPYEGADPTWRVHLVHGGINDREWDLIATGDTPAQAIIAARATAYEVKL